MIKISYKKFIDYLLITFSFSWIIFSICGFDCDIHILFIISLTASTASHLALFGRWSCNWLINFIQFYFTFKLKKERLKKTLHLINVHIFSILFYKLLSNVNVKIYFIYIYLFILVAILLILIWISVRIIVIASIFINIFLAKSMSLLAIYICHIKFLDILCLMAHFSPF